MYLCINALEIGIRIYKSIIADTPLRTNIENNTIIMLSNSTEDIEIYYVEENQSSKLIQMAFGGNQFIFTIFILLLCGSIFYYLIFDDLSLLYLQLFFFIGALEIYRENRDKLNPTPEIVNFQEIKSG